MSVEYPALGALSDTPCVLVVDDDALTRAIFAKVLRRDGLEVVEASDGASALGLIEERTFSMVLLDSRMPGMSGVEVLRTLRASERTRALPVILVTGETDLADRVQGLDAGADDYVIKPVDVLELVARVRSRLRARSVVLAAIESLRLRVAVLDVVGNLAAVTGTEVTASAICEEMLAMPGLNGATIIGFPGARVAVPLAASGTLSETFGGLHPLTEHDAWTLRNKAMLGPWIEAPGRDHILTSTADDDSVTAMAPLTGNDQLLGVAIIRSDASDRTASHQALSTAIDFASVIASLLRSKFGREDDAEEARSSIRQRINGSEFVPHFQPIVELETGLTVGYEALTRWTDGARPDLPFIEARGVGLGVELELATAAAAIGDALDFDAGLWLSINASVDLVLDPRLDGLLAAAGRSIVLEITEHDAVDDYQVLRRGIDRFRPRTRVAVDDAGAGYASLRHIIELAPDLVKLDISWVRGLEGERANQILVSGLKRFVTEIDGSMIAEGIETEETLAILRQLGVRFGQGFLLGRPTPASVLNSSH